MSITRLFPELIFEITTYMQTDEMMRFCSSTSKKMSIVMMQFLFARTEKQANRIFDQLSVPEETRYNYRSNLGKKGWRAYCVYRDGVMASSLSHLMLMCLKQQFTEAQIEQQVKDLNLISGTQYLAQHCKQISQRRIPTYCADFLENMVCSKAQKRLMEFCVQITRGYSCAVLYLIDSIDPKVRDSFLRCIDKYLYEFVPVAENYRFHANIAMLQEILQQLQGEGARRPLYALVCLHLYLGCLTKGDQISAKKFAALLTEEELAHGSHLAGIIYARAGDTVNAIRSFTNLKAPIQIQIRNYQRLHEYCGHQDSLIEVRAQLEDASKEKQALGNADFWILYEHAPASWRERPEILFSFNESASEYILLQKRETFMECAHRWRQSPDTLLREQGALNQSVFGGALAHAAFRMGRIPEAIEWISKLDFSKRHPYILRENLFPIIEMCMSNRGWEVFLRAYSGPSRDWLCALCAFQLQLEGKDMEALECMQLIQDAQEKSLATVNYYHRIWTQNPLNQTVSNSEMVFDEEQLSKYRTEYAWWLARDL